MKLTDFDYYLPEKLIAQTPLEKRDASRLMVIDREKQTYKHDTFENIVNYLKEGDVLVRNNTKVMPSRIYAQKAITGAHVELLILKIENDIVKCLVGNARTVKVGTELLISDKLKAICLEKQEDGIRVFKFIFVGILLEILAEVGTMPLPPYIHKSLKDQNRYQTIYAKELGSAAAPTAGLHFTDTLFQKLKEKGIIVVDITLHVGLGTFKSVKDDNILNHHMHSEAYYIAQDTADILNKAIEDKRRIIAVGTTSCRTLETELNKNTTFKEISDNSEIFIYPGYQFKAINGLITNFHLPKSTLIMLVSAFTNLDFIKECYQEAIKENYRFFSFGDAMLIL
ncbi:MAG: tRNA preQ1(34) S-adenosylmethionine ribosyltransferase-isomerase QueA [Bacillales bacterium]|jgi:S-adenosylmethionine:tRNA ribosyltransferase-isomerase|nr:tRNA preQ1(34) S-adenosylmethionine ribosyltransferase-isomerase QueA [Bacillales bacterium]